MDFFFKYPSGIQFLGWLLELNALILVALVSVAIMVKRSRQGKPWAMIRPGPLLTPNQLWGPRPDSGLTIGNSKFVE